MLKELKNTTDMAEEFIELVMLHVTPPDLNDYDLRVRNSKKKVFAGRAFPTGRTPFGDNGKPLIIVRLGAHSRFPHRVLAMKGNKRMRFPLVLANRQEAFVFTVAHEIRHCWQYQFQNRPRLAGGRGKYSEVDANAYAKIKLNEFRQEQANEDFLLEQNGFLNVKEQPTDAGQELEKQTNT